MKGFILYFLMLLVFLMGIYPGLIYGWIERSQDPPLTASAHDRYEIICDFCYFSSLFVILLLLKPASRKKGLFTATAIVYGLFSVLYSSILVKVAGALLLLVGFLRLYSWLFPDSQLWYKRNK